MSITIPVVGLAVAVVAALRSTWSPCALSMLSTITPMSERGRGNRFATTASWFVIGSTAGGASLGGAMGLLAYGYRATAAPAVVTLAVAATSALVASASDAGLGGFRLPIHRRQVNELWLDKFRSWVYGFGFGWQIGCGIATFITSAAVYLMVLLAVLSGNPLVAVLVGVVFGLIRGASVLLGRDVTDPATLRARHRRLAGLDRPAKVAVVVSELAAGSALLGAIWPPAFALTAILVTATVFIYALLHLRERRLAQLEQPVPARGRLGVDGGATALSGFH